MCREASASEVLREEVEDRVDAVALREDLTRHADERPPAVLPEELCPRRLAGGSLELDSRRDLCVRRVYGRVGDVAVGVKVREHAQTVLVEAVLDEEARRLREDEGPENEEEGETSLDDVRPTPGNLRGKIEEESITNPGRERVTCIEEDVLDRDEHAAGVTGSDFALEDGNRHGEDADSDALEGTANDERSKVRCVDLEDGGDEIDQSSDTNGHATTHDITDVRRAKGRNERGDVEARDGDGCRGNQCLSEGYKVCGLTLNIGIDSRLSFGDLFECDFLAEEPVDERRLDLESGDGGVFFMGTKVSGADVALAAYFKWLRELLPGEESAEWKQIREVDGGRWGRYVQQFAKWEAIV